MNASELIKKLKKAGLIQNHNLYGLYKIPNHDLFIEGAHSLKENHVVYKILCFKRVQNGRNRINLEQFLEELKCPKLKKEILFNLNLFQ